MDKNLEELIKTLSPLLKNDSDDNLINVSTSFSMLNKANTKDSNKFQFISSVDFNSFISNKQNSFTDKGIIYILLSNINIILIENQHDYFYPFIAFRLYNLVAKVEFQNFKGLFTIDVDTISKIVSYNYIADAWEPLIEKSLIKVNFTKQINANLNKSSFKITIPLQKHNLQQSLNVNLSDLNVIFSI